MISTGLSMGSQESIIACDLCGCILGQVLKFALGPIAMTIASKIVGLHGNKLRAAIIQAAVPQAISSFIFAKEYGLHPEIIITA
ncbi:Os12g0515200 [Oryza sativa Japonica Group]|uniref:Os12g0515200 protein n=1 Tax=Oryza sativa subsp. japonica TaxID=39947 RepID=A0A0P0YAS0_ORYSJ|nr:Os12g0515200 [Oryza sativa Japonica Group]